MRQRNPARWLLGLVAIVPSLVCIARESAHPGQHTAPPRPNVAPDPIVDPPPINVDVLFPHALARCEWHAQNSLTDSGGVMAHCQADAVPIASGVYLADYEDLEHKGLVNLSPAIFEFDGVTVEGVFDGNPLSDDHAQIHGEPPPDGTAAETYANTTNDSGTGIHYLDLGSAPTHSNEIRTLCCESLESNANLNELEGCRYESAFVLVAPETDPDLPGQYVAKLACSTGHITSGGCYTQFLHSSDYALTGNHPYVDGDGMQHPDGPHGATPGETGWACRLDHEPVIDGYNEGIGITAVCCH